MEDVTPKPINHKPKSIVSSEVVKPLPKPKPPLKRSDWIIALSVLVFFIGIIVFIIVLIANAVANAAPSIGLTSAEAATPQTAATSYLVAGTASSGAIVTIDGHPVNLTQDGSFSATVPLQQGDNQVTIVAMKHKKQTKAQFVIHRYTTAELAAQQAAAVAAAQAAQQAAAQAAAQKATQEVQAAATKAAQAKQAIKQQVATWDSKYGYLITNLTNDFTSVGNASGDSNALLTACTAVFDDATEAEGKPAIPDTQTEHDWATALDLYVNGAQDCQYGLTDSNSDQINKATAEFTQGNTSLDAATTDIQNL